MIAPANSTLVDKWQQRIGRRRRTEQPRMLAALGYLVVGSLVDNLVEIEKLVLVVQHDEILPNGRCALRMAGFSGTPVPWGVQWGGPDGSRLYKDLRLRPEPGARGLRLDAANEGLFELGLRLERDLQRFDRNGIEPAWRQFRLPTLWAGFTPSADVEVTGAGPELEATARHLRRTPAELFRETSRQYFQLSLHPLNWVSHEWERITAVFADLEGSPKRQVIAVQDPAAGLVGHYGAAAFDFYSSRFREHYDAHLRHAPCRGGLVAGAAAPDVASQIVSEEGERP